jgi:membrane-associated phospholipid phosphatase
MTIYVAGTMLATVYLGWHFAVDLVGGAVIAYVAVYLGRLTIYPQSTRARLIPRRTRRQSLRRRSVASRAVWK